MRRDNASDVRGYRSVADVIFELDEDELTDCGWVIFEESDNKLDSVIGTIGIIGTINNYVTLRLLRHMRARRPLRVRGAFDDAGRACDAVLDRVTAMGGWFSDVSSVIGFRAVVARPSLRS